MPFGLQIAVNAGVVDGGWLGGDVYASPAGGIGRETRTPSPMSSTRNILGIGLGSEAVANLTVNIAAFSLRARQA